MSKISAKRLLIVVVDKNCNAYDNDDTVDIENRVGTDYINYYNRVIKLTI
jgi:hypothetical protein